MPTTERNIEVYHQQDCRSRDGKRCSCRPSYTARVWDPVAQKRRKAKPVKSLAEAKRVRNELERAVESGVLAEPSSATFGSYAMEWLSKVERGQIRNRKGDIYKP